MRSADKRYSTLTLLIAATCLTGAPALADLPLGSAEVLSGPKGCGKQLCWRLAITCRQIQEPAQVTLKVGEPRGDNYRGTILLATGGGGQSLWERYGRFARRALRKLRREGYRTVQVAWEDRWLDGAPGELEGHANLACRPSTVTQWVWDNLQGGDTDAALCSTGNSGGAAQASYMLTHYGLGDVLSAVVPTGGPPMGRIDLGCLLGEGESPELTTLIYGTGSRQTIDRGFGFYDQDGPCFNQEPGFEDELEAASISTLDPNRYFFPDTMVWFVFGELDASSAVGQGITFFDRLVEAGSPLVEMSVAPQAPHATPSTRLGARAIRDALLESCHPWE